MYFPQEHPPGREAQIDFTHGSSLGVTIAGQRHPHLLFQLILSHSGWRYAEVAAGETFLALKQGLQNALWNVGRHPPGGSLGQCRGPHPRDTLQLGPGH